jgi:DNA-binding response OmpR family regulator
MRMRRVLIATDDPLAVAWMRHGLGQLGVNLAEVSTGGLAGQLEREEFELVLVDGGMDPDVLAQSVEQAVAKGNSTRLLVVVEREGLAHLRLPIRVTSDFVVRGASSEELAARVRNLLWPGEEVGADELVRIDNLTVNLATYQAYWGTEPIDFTYLEYALFTFLVTHPNRAYSRETLLRRVWGTDYFGGSRTVDVHIRRVRAKLPVEVGGRLVTVRNVGYLWRS